MIAVVPSWSGRSTLMSTCAWPLSVELDVVDAPDRDAADQDLVPLDQLAAGLEQQAVVVAAAAAESSRKTIAITTSARAPIAARRANPPPPRTRALCGEAASSPGLTALPPEGGPVAQT